MEILIALTAMTAIGIVVMVYSDPRDYLFGLLGALMTYTGVVLLVSALAFIPVHRMSVQAGIARFQETRAVAERMRDKGATWEAAAFQAKIADMNGWMREMQYYNGTVFDLWIPDAVDELEPIK